MDVYKPALGMIGLQFTYAGVALFTRAALLQGLSPRVFVVYRQGIATLVIVPIAYFSRRRNPDGGACLGLKTFGWISLASLIGVTANQNAYFEGLYLASSTVASSMTNLIPAVTFVMAAILGWEKVNRRIIVKIIGTVVCVSGAVTMAVVKGPKLLNSPKSFLSQQGDNWLLGCLLLLASSFCWSFWMILQVPISLSCPDHLYSSAWMCFLATIQSTTIALLTEKNLLGAFALGSFFEFSCCLYTGIALAVSFFVQAWCISQRGPLFAAMFNPLCTVIVAVFAALFLHEETYIGSLVGASAVIIGLYVVLWGKARDFEEMKQEITDKSNPKNGDAMIVQVLEDESSNKKKSKSDLQEPLLSDNYSINVDQNGNQLLP